MMETPTRERLLDAAEALIARQGYDNTSLRAITEQAGANVAAVNYHFGSKEGLAEAVLRRRLIPIDKERMARLEAECRAARNEDRAPGIEALLRALIEPILRTIHTEKGGRHFIFIISRMHTDADGVLKRLFLKTIQPSFVRFFKAFQEACPELPSEILLLRISFTIGAMSHAAMVMSDWGLLERLPFGKLDVPTIDRSVDELIRFAARGFMVTGTGTHV